VVGYIGGEQVAEQRISADGVPKQLHFSADFAELHADGADMTRLVVRITDEFGNTLPYAQQAVTFSLETDTDAALVGENPLVLPGGQGAVYLRAGHTAGQVTVTAQTLSLSSQSVKVNVS